MSIKTITNLVSNSIEKFADRVAYVMLDSHEVTYREAGEEIKKLQEELLSSGVSSGDKVALLSSNMPNWGIAYFAITSAGMIVVPILPDFSSDELAMILSHSEAKALVVSDKLHARLPQESLDAMNVVVRVKNMQVISRNCTDRGVMTPPQEQDLAAIIYTSGTTSKPKGVMLTHFNLVRQIELLYILFPITEEERFISLLPLSHTLECSLGMIYPFAYGGKVTYLDRPPIASVLLPALRKVKPTLMLIVPLIIEKIFRAQVEAKFTSTPLWRAITKPKFMRNYFYRIAGKKLYQVFGGSLRFLGIGGAKLDPQVEEFLMVSGMPYAIGYGLTETAPVLAGAVPGKTRLGSTGPIMEGMEIRLENVNEQTGEGEIVVNTPCRMVGYYKNEEATREVITEDGWFRTGDLGLIDKDGMIHIKGRLKNMILGPSGENIYPEEIEGVINSHIYIAESLVTENDGRLVALVHFDTDKLEAQFEEWQRDLRCSLEQKMKAWEEHKESIMNDIQKYVNSKVNRFSKISEVKEEKNEFIKTPTHKIKRFMYKDGNSPSEEQIAAEKARQEQAK